MARVRVAWVAGINPVDYYDVIRRPGHRVEVYGLGGTNYGHFDVRSALHRCCFSWAEAFECYGAAAKSDDYLFTQKAALVRALDDLVQRIVRGDTPPGTEVE